MFSANSDVSTKPDMTRSMSSVPSVESRPSAGTAAATTPRNTSSSSTVRIGNAISSAFVRSERVWSLTSLKLTANPPRRTSSGLKPIRRRASSAASPPSLSMSWIERFAAITSERPLPSTSARASGPRASGFVTWPT